MLTIALLTALAGVADYGAWAALPRFLLATLALAGLAWVVSFATEQLGERFGPAVTGMLQSTLGNLPELFVVIFALQKGELVVAQTAIVGSMLANALLVLGLVIVVGARRSNDGADALLQAAAARHGDAVAGDGVHHRAARAVTRLARPRQPPRQGDLESSARSACWSSTSRGSFPTCAPTSPPTRPASASPRTTAPARVQLLRRRPARACRSSSRWRCCSWPALRSAFVSDWFVNALQPAIVQLHVSQAFAGLVIVAIAGNAVENAAGLVLAWKGRSDLAISVVKNSVAQIAAFLFPLLVLISFALSTTLTFSLAPVYIGALLLSTLALAQVTGDGEAAEFEGWALVALYVILGALTLYE